MKLLPWAIAAAAVAAAVVGTNKLREARRPAPESSARLIAAAASEINHHRPAEALRKLRAIPTADLASPRAREIEGEALFALHYAGQAEAKWLEAVHGNPSLEEAPFRLFDLYFLSGRHVGARKLAVELAPKQESPAAAAAMLLEAIRQEHERAAAATILEHFEAILLREPDDGHALRAVGRSYVELGRVTEGLRLLKSATEKLPDDAETWAVRFESLHDAGRSAQVAAAFVSAPAEVRKHPRVLRAVAAALDAQGDAKGAEDRLQEALKADPFNRKAHTQLAALLRRRDATAAAKKHEESAKELDEVRERQAALFHRAHGQQNNPGPELMHRLAAVCRDLGWTDVAGELNRLASRGARPPGQFGG